MSKLRNIILLMVACLSLATPAQAPASGDEPEWYLEEVVSDMFIGRYDFEYYYMPGAAEMSQQRDKGEVSYFLNSPAGLNRKKTCDLIDRIMASYDDVKVVGDWHMTTAIYWKEFRVDRNRFRFNVKRKALDDGTYYVSVTESANYYKSLSKKDSKKHQAQPESSRPKDKSARRSTRDRRQVTQDEADAADVDVTVVADAVTAPVVSETERRRAAREQEEAQRQEERLAKRRAQEEQRAHEKARKEAEKQRKAEEKKQREEEKRLKREQERQRREQERLDREAARKQASTPKAVESKYHYTDVALWLSEKYDFTQTAAGSSSCTMFSTAVKDVEMAKLAIKNALKGSRARMAVPWRVNASTGAIETGYVVDGHVLVFAIAENEGSPVSLTITEVTAEELEDFKQGMNQ